jgi:hypothetical protein|tara:strand:- start:258 stop:1004 length:747 start_codon:yes stop_codon:yes gene_type:complete
MINVNTVYKSVLSILNKEQRGFLTPDEFNKLAKQAQLNLLELAFAEYNKFLSMDNLGRINAGYADLPEKIKEKIEVFYATSTLSGPPYSLPSNVFKLIDVNMLDKTLSLEEVDKNELSYILSSPLTKPSKDFPVYYKTTTASTGATSIVVSPATTDTISVDYIRIPTEPRFGYTVNSTYGTNVYDATPYNANTHAGTTQGSTNFELHPSEETMLIMAILTQAGVVIKSTDIVSFAAQSMSAQAAIKAQ